MSRSHYGSGTGCAAVLVFRLDVDGFPPELARVACTPRNSSPPRLQQLPKSATQSRGDHPRRLPEEEGLRERPRGSSSSGTRRRGSPHQRGRDFDEPLAPRRSKAEHRLDRATADPGQRVRRTRWLTNPPRRRARCATPRRRARASTCPRNESHTGKSINTSPTSDRSSTSYADSGVGAASWRCLSGTTLGLGLAQFRSVEGFAQELAGPPQFVKIEPARGRLLPSKHRGSGSLRWYD